MNKKLAAALSGGAVLVLALSGCGDSDEEKLDNWAKSLCGQIQPQLEKSVKAQQKIVSTAADGKPEDIQKADSEAFKAIADADKAIAGALEKAGPPPVDNGEKIQQDAIKDLNEASKAYEKLKKDVDGLDAKDQSPEGLKAFSEGLQKVADDLGKIQKQGDGALNALLEGDVGAAIKKQDACKANPSTAPGPSKA
ncbi:small secreted protein [Streptomyces sp. B-S-A8]|uniref:Small secreted protein n=1 Tax=Streptomyces solicavernae TaxID=3043614 RepID=A0ABT6RYY8_9ACTN|nr:small secreted protein [Streptomyces sp. B-S-A8]MDI3389617.1 small secreted protein [Streptomyces sp. B-S-A8]